MENYSVQVIPRKDEFGNEYIDLDDLPKDQHEPFEKWIYGQTYMEVNGKPAYYCRDYEMWYSFWSMGLPLPWYE